VPVDSQVPPDGDHAMPLHGRVALVTGAARGLGRQLAGALALAGADVAVTARDEQALQGTVGEIRSEGRRTLPLALDLRDRGSTGPVVDAVVAAMGRIDVLICNSGVSGPSQRADLVLQEAWDETMAVNLTGTFACASAVARQMVAARRGVILFVGSMTGKRPLLHRAPYAASKMALVGLCRTMAIDLGPEGVRVNVLSPGFVEGARLDWVVTAQAEAQGRPVEEVRRELVASSPLRRLTSPADVARTAVFLASDAAAGITGEDVNVSSGLVMY